MEINEEQLDALEKDVTSAGNCFVNIATNALYAMKSIMMNAKETDNVS